MPIAVAAAILVAFLLTRREIPTYSASASVIVVPEGTAVESTRDQIDALGNLDRRSVVATIAGLAHSRDVLGRAARRSGLHEVANIAGPEVTNTYRVYRLRMLDDALVPTRAVSPDMTRNLLTGGVLGLLAGLLVAAGIEWARPGLASPPS